MGGLDGLTSALIKNACTFFIISDKLEVLSEIVNPIYAHDGLQNFTRKYHFCTKKDLLIGVVQVSEWNFDPTTLEIGYFI